MTHTNRFEPFLSLGTVPSVADGNVTRKACLPTLDCNTTNYDITLKNCGPFTAYYLKRPDSCDQAYCFGKINLYLYTIYSTILYHSLFCFLNTVYNVYIIHLWIIHKVKMILLNYIKLWIFYDSCVNIIFRFRWIR